MSGIKRIHCCHIFCGTQIICEQKAHPVVWNELVYQYLKALEFAFLCQKGTQTLKSDDAVLTALIHLCLVALEYWSAAYTGLYVVCVVLTLDPYVETLYEMPVPSSWERASFIWTVGPRNFLCLGVTDAPYSKF